MKVYVANMPSIDSQTELSGLKKNRCILGVSKLVLNIGILYSSYVQFMNAATLRGVNQVCLEVGIISCWKTNEDIFYVIQSHMASEKYITKS